MKRIRIARELTTERLTELLAEHGEVTVVLADLAKAPNPASTSRALYGPSLVTYVKHPAGIDTYVEDSDCPGHPNDGSGPIGETVYCDGTCLA